ncbi:SPOR domain-containing protein [Mangrovimonas sp. YM274]|uniref:SPOR domain-containing protein n=1 Tax=Mangrovimonas sp. YM274 TaxID=3070660 RepID=UPI0027DAC28F|nr:SPOR domain-containing protein [Mangrovimonas sp. YM274]WMI69384.1 SPOR domain-containing protein [Mangrovimonas sp. YM274]
MTHKNTKKALLGFCLFLGAVSYIHAQQGIVTVDKSKEITQLLEFKKDINTVALYKIQIFSGNRSGAEKAQSEFNDTYEDWPVAMEYDTPHYKIQVGTFRSRLEADKALIKIKANYPNAFIFQPKTEIK